MVDLPTMEPMEDYVLVQRIEEAKAKADYEGTSSLSFQREQGQMAYAGQATAGLQPTTGMSSILDNKIQPCVEILATYMTKIFCSDKETVVFNPSVPQMFPAAEQAMKLANHVIHKSNNGYEVINRCVKDAGINKNSVIKIVWDETPESYEEEYSNISREQLMALVLKKEQSGLEVEIIEEEVQMEQMAVETPEGMAVVDQEVSSEYKLRCTHPKALPTLQNLPPEEFLINEGATVIDRNHHLLNFVCHRKLMYVGDVYEMFPDAELDEVYASSSADNLYYEYETQSRHSFDGTYHYTSNDGSGAMQQVELTESWIKEDVDGTGTAQWYHVFTAGHTLLMKELWDGELPFVSFCYFPIPHKFYGLSVHDKLQNYYRAATGLLRSEIDMRLQQNTFRIIADPRYVDQKDLQSGRPGIIKASKGFDPSKVMPVPAPAGSGNTLQILQYLDQEIQKQIGLSPLNGAISSDVEKSGNDSEKTSQVVDNSSAKVEGYAREFAEHCMRPLIWIIIKQLVEHKDDYSVKLLLERLTPGQPFMLAQSGMLNLMSMSDLTAKVGLGHMTSDQKMRGISVVKQEQMMLEQAGIVITPDKKIAVAEEIARVSGYENTQDFFPTKEEAAQNDQVIQAMVQQAQEQGMLQGQQQAMQAAEIQETMSKAQLNQAKIADMDADNKREDMKAQAEIYIEQTQQRPAHI